MYVNFVLQISKVLHEDLEYIVVSYDFLLKSITVMLITVNNGKGEEKILILELVNSVVDFLHLVTTTF